MINEGKLTNYGKYVTGDLVNYMLEDMDVALDSLYTLQNAISLSRMDQTSQDKSVSLHFLTQEDTLKTLKFSLSEAVLQVASAVFTVKHFNLTQFSS